MNIPADRNHLEQPLEQKKQRALDVVQRVAKVARRPIVAFSGGLHSCIALAAVREVIPNVEAYMVDIKLAFPDHAAWVAKFMGNSSLRWFHMATPDWTNDEEFMRSGIVFKGLQHVPTKEWERFRINARCRRVRQKWDRRLLKRLKVDYVFTGLLGDEKAQRMRWWLKDGYVKKRGDGIWHVKPIAHYTMDDCEHLAKSGAVEYYERMYDDCGRFRQGDMGCWMCTVRLRNSSAGNLGFLSRNYPKLFRKLMYDFNGAEQLKAIQIAYPKPWLGRFIEEYL